MRARLFLWTVPILLIAMASIDATSRDTSSRALGMKLVLPESPFEYARPALPKGLDRGALRRYDNTPRANHLTNAGATLGRVLFYDPLLSSTGQVSCSSCHAQDRAFAEGRRRSRGVHGRLGKRNSMSLVNARYHPTDRFFWDERAGSLEEQVLKPIQDPLEMALSLEEIAPRVRLRPEYAELFRKAFRDSGVTNERIANSLAQFVRSLVSFRSRYDEGLARVEDVGEDFPNFTKQENAGKALFFARGRGGGGCAGCHTVDGRRGRGGRGSDEAKPRLFMGRSASNNGLDRKASVRDGGIGAVTGEENDLGVFKSPSLRNVELTAPYMHDGRLRTLEAVIQHYNRQVEPHPNLDRRLRGRRGDAGVRRLNLNSRERKALVSFLKTLTDRAFVNDPRFSTPFR